MTSTVRMAGQTDVGQSRHDNQDTFLCQSLWSAHTALLVVIDGVGGYAGGAQAAALASDSIVQYMATPTGDTLTMLREAVVYANNQIARQRLDDPELGRMCCVLTAAVVDTALHKLYFVHVGDTRLYRFRGQKLKKLTHDHSLVGIREDANQLTEREAMRHPRRNEILRMVGATPHRIDDPDFLESDETDFLPGDVILLCSDGLTDMLTRAAITAVLTQPIPVDEQIRELIRQANEQGGQDNITVVLAHDPAQSNVPTEPVKVPGQPNAEETVSQPEATVSGDVAKPVSQRTWKRWLVVLPVLAMLALLLWWHDTPTKPTKPPVAVPPDSTTKINSTRRPDSSGINNATTQPDSIRSSH